MRLFCFPYAGGGASAFRAWWRAFPTQVEVCSVQPPGREHRLREEPYTDFVSYVESLTDALEHWTDLPSVFFGHSLGALTSFECARRLRGRGAAGPSMLFVSGCRAPHIPAREAPVRELPDDLFLGELRRLNGTPQEALDHPELMALLLPLVRADFSVYESYEYRADAPLDCAIHAFGGDRDERVTEADLAGWSEHTASRFSARIFPGDHFFLHPAQPALVKTITRELEGGTANVQRG